MLNNVNTLTSYVLIMANTDFSKKIIFFNNLQELTKYQLKIPSYFRFLFLATNSSNIIFKLAGPDKDVYVSAHIPSTPKLSISKYIWSATVLDLTNFNQVIVEKSGLLNWHELTSFLPKTIQITKNINLDLYNITSKINKAIHRLQSIQDLPKPTAKTLIIATKEKLKASFDYHFEDYFTVTKRDNFILLNLGSQTSLSNIYKNLYYNLLKINEFEVDKVYLLCQSWGKNTFAEIIDNILTANTLTPAQDDLDLTAQETQKMTIPQKTRPSILANKRNIWPDQDNFLDYPSLFTKSTVLV